MRNQSLPTKMVAMICVGMMAGITAAIIPLPSRKVLAQPPTPFLISPYFGQKGTPSQGYSAGHPAYDWGMSYQRVLAAAEGSVDTVQWYNNNCHNSNTWPTDPNNCGYGLYARINHGNNYRTIYAHLSATAFSNPGDSISRGQIIGTSGNTGWSTAPHLHFQVQHYINNIWTSIDPFNENGGSLWIDGEWANPSRPIPEPNSGGDVIVDDTPNNSGGFSKGSGGPFNNSCQNDCGGWTSAGTGLYGDMYYTPADGNTSANQWARWRASGLPANGGIYEVYVYVPNVNATTWQARYTIRYYNDLMQTTALVDQYGLYNQWVSLGTYYMTANDYVYTTDATQETYGQHCGAGQWCRLGVDTVKFVRRGTTYLPKASPSGDWTVYVVAYNNGGGPAKMKASLLDSNGLYQCGALISIPANSATTLTWSSASCPQAAAGIVEASQDIAVVLERQHTDGRTHAYNGIAAADPRNPDWGQVGTDIHLPDLMKNSYGWSTSVSLLNTGSAQAYYDFDCFGQVSGGPWHIHQGWLGPQASTTFEYSEPQCPSVGAGRITSDQPLAVVVTQKATGVTTSYNGVSAGATTVNLPLIMANSYTWMTGIAVQNLGSSAADITATFYPSPTYPIRNSETITSVQPNAMATFVQSGGQWGSAAWVGSARVTAAQPIAAIVNQVAPGKGSTYNSFANGTSLVILPDVRNNYGGWTSGVKVQNLDSATANVVLRVNGSQIWLNPIGAFQSITLYPLPGTSPGFQGSATLACTNGRRIAAIVNNVASGAGDLTMTYNGVNR